MPPTATGERAFRCDGRPDTARLPATERQNYRERYTAALPLCRRRKVLGRRRSARPTGPSPVRVYLTTTSGSEDVPPLIFNPFPYASPLFFASLRLCVSFFPLSMRGLDASSPYTPLFLFPLLCAFAFPFSHSPATLSRRTLFCAFAFPSGPLCAMLASCYFQSKGGLCPKIKKIPAEGAGAGSGAH
jgi:hypothetical protein